MNDQNSILDKVLHSKQAAEIQDFNPGEIISSLLKYLTNKEEDVLRRRFGLNGKTKETLESIGKAYHVTRERVRQIESTAIKKIKDLKEFARISNQVERIIFNVLSQNGRVMEENAILVQLLSFASDNPINRHCTIFILEELLSGRTIKVEPSTIFKKSWGLPGLSLEFVEQTINQLIELISKEGKPMLLAKLLEEYFRSPYYLANKEKFTEEVINSYITISQKIDKNPFEQFGLTEWGTINPRRMRDKIYLVLKKEGKPLHFNKITELINKVKFDDRRAYAPTVHNELILNDDFVLVGRGIYGLKEWGYRPGVVAEVLIDILKKTKEPLSREELVNRVLKQRIVRKNTIHLALTDKTRFKKLADKRYTLVETESSKDYPK